MNYLWSSKRGIKILKAKPTDRFIVFSDFHRGLSDKADDFKQSNERSYRAALSHYFHQGFSLIHLGDIEELKEQFSIAKVLKHREALMQSEIMFYNAKRFYKIFGNHDSQWGNPRKVKKYLHRYFPKLEVFEGIILEYEILPNVFMVHGHQGYTWLKTNVVEKLALPVYRWALNFFGIERKTNYESYCKIEKIENEFYEWVNDQKDLLVIFGHTHRPLWGSSTHVDALKREFENKRNQLEKIAKANNKPVWEIKKYSALYEVEDLIDSMNKIIQRIREKMAENGSCSAPIPLPLLFNTGNCINKDGDITGIEIDGGKIKLIKWGLSGGTTPERFEYESGELSGFII